MPTTRSGRTGASTEEVTSRESTEESTSRVSTWATQTSSEPSTEQTQTTSTEATVAVEPSRPTKSPLAKSTSSVNAKKKQKALRIARAEEDLINLQIKLAAARLRTLELEKDSDDDDSIAADEDIALRVDNWLEDAHPAGTSKKPTVIEPPPKEAPRNESHKIEEGKTARAPQVDLSELAAAITLAARSTPHGRTELPAFDGAHNEWLSFKAAYQESYASCTQTENIGRLRRALRGKAKEAVENLLIYNANVEEIMKTLEARFGRPDTIALAETERLRALPRLTDNPREICVFASRVTNIVTTLRALKKLHYLYNPEALKTTIEKLTPVLRYRWYDYAAEHEEDTPDLEKLASFLNRESERCSPYAPPESIQPVEKPAPVNRRVKTYNTTEIEKCVACGEEGHCITKCRKFTNATTEERWDIAKNRKLCFACLRYRTRTHHCRRQKCNIEDCRYWHHELLHHRKKIEASDKPTTSETVTSTWEAGSTAYLKIVPVHISGPVGGVDTYALLDDGSTVTLIDEEIANKTGMNGPLQPLHIEAIGDQHLSSSSRRVKISIQGPSQQSFAIKARTIKNLKISSQAITKRLLSDCHHLRDIEKDIRYTEAAPRLLIGQDNWHLLLASEVRKGRRHQPVASRTPLGWVLHGARTYISSNRQRVNFITVSEEEKMNDQLRDYFAIESLMIQPKQPQNSIDERAMKKLNSEVIERDGQYEAPLLWKNENAALPNNYDNTLKRLHNIEKKLDRDAELKRKYSEQMEALINKGYAERAPPQKHPSHTWYLPHFAVVNPMKPGKIRIVHDAAAKTKGVSLNDHLMTGPDLIQSLPGVLMRFRQRRIAITADIREMFMQVKIKSEDRDALRYLWRGDRRDDNPPDEYRMTSLIFGATCSPSIAIHVKNINASRYKEKEPQVYEAIVRNHYVDDLLNSYDTDQDAISSARRIAEIHKEANYELRQWCSNSEAVLNALATQTTRSDVTIDSNKNIERALGVTWRPTEDTIGFNLDLARLPSDVLNSSQPTKRETLRVLMSLFDPLGLASPVTIKAKQILQEIWRRGTEWDEPIEEDLAAQWVAWLEDLKNLQKIEIPRCYYCYSCAESLQLHVFVDASETAYSAVAYWRAATPEGVHVSLVAAKAKVCPLKLTSVPRLELQAAVMGSRLGRNIIEEHDVKPETTIYWTDSRTVLTWLKTGPRSYRPFVAHRVAAIEENSSFQDWRWIPTSLNVADDATRDTPPDFNVHHRWFRGPAFLRDDPATWPSESPTLETFTGEEKVNTMRAVDTSLREAIPDPSSFSRWERLLRTTARVLQFIDLCRPRNRTYYRRQKKNKQSDPDWKKNRKIAKPRPLAVTSQENNRKFIEINVTHLQRAEDLIVRLSQQESFSDELRNIENAKKGKLHTLAVENISGVLKIKSRINATRDVESEVKNPTVLSGDHRVAKLYIDYIHRRLHHAGVEPTINECRTRYWITRLRTTARMIIYRCVICRLNKKSPPQPPTGNLPACRLAHHQRPFTYTGLDYFGPVTVTVGRAVQKRYVALFTCLTTRAVHLEVAASLTTSSAVMALRRFIARRGCPTELWSDNGTNLRGADKELRRAADDATQHESSVRGINWRYVPPGAPFMGGAWERLVRSVKNALATTLHDRHPSEEVLATLLAEVEFTVNNRPLTHVSVDPADPEALTPNHFLLWGPALHPTPGRFEDSDLIHRGHWRASQRLADIYWERWVREYLPDLQQRREPHGRGEQLALGDVVLIVDNTLPRNTWPMGKVVATYPGGDGVVRVVDVQTSGGVLRRPTKKIVIIVKVTDNRPHRSN